MTSQIIDLRSNHPLNGTWRCCGDENDIEITIDFKASGATVSIIDRYDGEILGVYDISWDAASHVLSCGVHWSTGRFVRYRFSHCSRDDRVDVTYTYTDRETWERVQT